VAVAWHVTPDRPHDSPGDTDLAASADPILDWFTKNEYERYLTELSGQAIAVHPLHAHVPH
jgi:hypothetical protein